MPDAIDPSQQTDRVLHRSEHCVVGVFDLPPGHRLWRTENRIDSGPLIAIPWTAVEIDRSGARRELMDPNRVAYYQREQPYARRVVSSRGDRCLFIVPSDRLLHDALAASGLTSPGDGYPFATGPAVSEATQAQHRLARALCAERPPLLPIDIDDAATHIVALLLAEAARQAGRRPPRAGPGERARRDVVARARAVMNARLDHAHADASLSINDLADETEVSPFHLARIFREHTGDSPARYYRRLRLRTAAEAVANGQTHLTDIALRFGFSSHAHFSAAWRSEFGAPPSALRRA